MKAEELIVRFRYMVDDEDLGQESDMLWRDKEVLHYIDRAQREACIRSKILTGKQTLSYFSASSTVTFSSRIIRINKIVLDSTSREISSVDEDYMDRQRIDWRTETGDIEAYTAEWGNRLITLWRQPTADGTLTASVVMLPLAPVTALTDVMEIGDEYLDKLLDGIAFYAYNKKDSQTYNQELSKYHHDLFTLSFGPPVSARNELVFRKDNKSRVGVRAHFL